MQRHLKYRSISNAEPLQLHRYLKCKVRNKGVCFTKESDKKHKQYSETRSIYSKRKQRKKHNRTNLRYIGRSE